MGPGEWTIGYCCKKDVRYLLVDIQRKRQLEHCEPAVRSHTLALLGICPLGSSRGTFLGALLTIYWRQNCKGNGSD